jgi:hypothetical protein
LKTCSTTDCETNCLQTANPSDLVKFQAALDCAVEFCGTEQTDAGAGRCQKTGQVYEDAPGAPAGSCEACLEDALSPLFGTSCSSMSSPDCDPPLCKKTRAACGIS